MSLKTDCQLAIYSYAPQIRQTNAALDGEHQDYVTLVISSLRFRYEELKIEGATEWSIDDFLREILDAEKPY